MRFLRAALLPFLAAATMTVFAQTTTTTPAAPTATPPAQAPVAVAVIPKPPAPPAPAPLPAMSPAEKARIQAIVHEYILQKPEVILDALQILQRKQYESAQQTVKDTQKNAAQFATLLFKQANDPVAGNPNGKITIVEFFDYQCPHCVKMVPVMDTILKANPQVRIVFKELPLQGDVSLIAAKAALAAHKQQKYSTFSHALLTANKQLNEEVIYQIAQNAGINVEQLKKDMADPAIDNQLKVNFKLAQDLKLIGTPAFFITKTDLTNLKNINYIPGELTQDRLQDAINNAEK